MGYNQSPVLLYFFSLYFFKLWQIGTPKSMPNKLLADSVCSVSINVQRTITGVVKY